MLKINEVFGPTIQGEGPTQGKKVVFLRLSTCNLHCVWCDTPYTWNWTGTKFEHPQKFDKSKEMHIVSNEVILARLRGCGLATTKALVVSGGEPLLQQKELSQLLREIRAMFPNMWVEVETNGTIAPSIELLELVDRINCSPKLNNSGNEPHLMTKPQALKNLAECGKAIFKFVVTQYADIHEIRELINNHNLTNIYLMPEGRTEKELNKHTSVVQLLCDEKGYHFADRLHIRLFGAKRGV